MAGWSEVSGLLLVSYLPFYDVSSLSRLLWPFPELRKVAFSSADKCACGRYMYVVQRTPVHTCRLETMHWQVACPLLKKDILLTPGNRFKNDDSEGPLISLFRLPLTPRWSRHYESLIELALASFSMVCRWRPLALAW